MNVLSLFDGMSCLHLALDRAGIKVDNYYASEIDKHAIKVTQHNYPDTIQLGDIKNVHAKDLPKIDLVAGGSTCQGFSFAGKQLAFDDPRSALFFEFVRLWNEVKEINPDAKFILENVKMKKEHELVISQYMGVAPIEINSALVSAQNRVRLYWTNIAQKPYGLFGDMFTDIPQPKDKGILLKDILEDEVDEKYFLSDATVEKLIIYRERERGNGFTSKFHEETEKMSALKIGGGGCDDLIIQLNQSKESGGQQPYQQNRVYDINGISPCLDSLSGQKNILIPEADVITSMKLGRSPEFTRENKSNKAYALDTKGKDGFRYGGRIRRLTPVECERLQTVPDGYTSCVSDSQRYKMLGNGWTIDVIAHILNYY